MRTLCFGSVLALLLLFLPACGSPRPHEWTNERQLIVIKPEVAMAQINATLLATDWKRDIDEERSSSRINEPRETYHQALRCRWSRHKPVGVSALGQVGVRTAAVPASVPVGVVAGVGLAPMTEGASLLAIPLVPPMMVVEAVSPLDPPEPIDQLRFAVHPHPDGAIVLAAYDTPVAAQKSREVYAAVLARAQAELRRQSDPSCENAIARTACTAPR